jgi:hypothetical protein
MQAALRPYATAGIALVGASMIAVTPVAVPPISAQLRSVQLIDAWSDLITESTANWQNILSHADMAAITQVYSELLTNPVGVIEAFSNTTPTVTTDLASLPGQITVELPPGLALAIANLGAAGAALTALHDVAPQLTNPLTAFEAVGTVLNAYLNGQDNISLLDGTITIPFFNGILAPLQPVDINLSLTNLVDALGLGGLKLTDLDLSALLSQLGLGNLTLGSLFNDLGIGTDKLGDLLAGLTNPITTLGGVLDLLGLQGLDVGTLNLTSLLSGLGLDTNVNLNSLTLDQVLTAFGLDPNVNIGLGTLLTDLAGTDSALGTFLNTGLGTELNNLGLLTGLVSTLNSSLGTLLGPQAAVINAALALISPGLTISSLLTTNGLQTVLDADKVSDLLGGGTLNDSLAHILTALGVGGVMPSGLTIGGLLHDLGFASATGDLSLGQLLGDLGNPILGLSVTDLLNGLTVDDLLGDLNLSNLPIDLSNLGDISQLTLGGLLGDLGLGDLADLSVQPIGGTITELVDVVPQQILAALGL